MKTIENFRVEANPITTEQVQNFFHCENCNQEVQAVEDWNLDHLQIKTITCEQCNYIYILKDGDWYTKSRANLVIMRAQFRKENKYIVNMVHSLVDVMDQYVTQLKNEPQIKQNLKKMVNELSGKVKMIVRESSRTLMSENAEKYGDVSDTLRQLIDDFAAVPQGIEFAPPIFEIKRILTKKQ
jgi:uncharacterized CHY-type Zn-finger protein